MYSFTAGLGITHSIGKTMSIDIGLFYEHGLSDLKYTEPLHQADYLNTLGVADKTI